MLDFSPAEPRSVIPLLFYTGFLDSEADPQVLLTAKSISVNIVEKAFRATRRWEFVLELLTKRGYVDGLQLRAVNRFLFSIGGYLPSAKRHGFERLLGHDFFRYVDNQASFDEVPKMKN